MKGGSPLRRLPAMTRSLSGLLVMSLAVLALPASTLAATPVDVYQDMESGKDGDELTAAVMKASNHGAGSWKAQSGTMWVGTAFTRDLPGPVVVDGVTYDGKGGTRTWKLNDKTTNYYVSCNLSRRIRRSPRLATSPRA